MQEVTYIASSLSATTTTHHGGLDSAAPPAIAGAGGVVDQREVGLLQLGGQAATSWKRQKHTLSTTVKTQTQVLNHWKTHWRCAPIQWRSRCFCGAESGQREAEGQAGRRSSDWPGRTNAAGLCQTWGGDQRVKQVETNKLLKKEHTLCTHVFVAHNSLKCTSWAKDIFQKMSKTLSIS